MFIFMQHLIMNIQKSFKNEPIKPIILFAAFIHPFLC